MKNTWKSIGPEAVSILLLTLAVYLPAMHNGFVFDDYPLVVDNRLVKANDGLHRFWFTTEAADYYPLTSSLWWLEWRLWGVNPMGYHLVSVLLHAANAVLVWLILRRLKIPGAWMAALVFAVHPVNVATVAWISEQKNTLSMLFYAAAILLYLRFDEEGRWHWFGLSLTAFLLALLSKSAVVMLPVVLLGCVWWRHGRVRWKDTLCSAPFFAFSLISGLVTIWFQSHRALGGVVVRTEGFAARLAAAGWVSWFYLGKALLSLNLTLAYPHWEIDAARGLSYLPGIILVGCFLVFWWKRSTWGRPLLFALGYFVVTLFPVLGFFDQGFYTYALVADHWQYFSIIAVIALVVAAGKVTSDRLGVSGRYWGRVAGAALLLALGAATWRRDRVYADDESLWRDNLIRNPSAWLAHDNLGNALWQRGTTTEAKAHWVQALRVKPDDVLAHDNLGAALWEEGKTLEAMEYWEQALRINPIDAKAHNSLGVVMAQMGKTHEAIAHWEQALRSKPDDARTHNNLGLALVQEEHIPEAIGHYEEALRIDPDYFQAHCNLGVALERNGKMEEAIGHYEQALRIRPDYAEARNHLTKLRSVQ
jgi:tetratricopeptide (TPR) repeat protein